MKKENNTKGLNGKDLLNVGIFTAVYFVLNLLAAAVLGMMPRVARLGVHGMFCAPLITDAVILIVVVWMVCSEFKRVGSENKVLLLKWNAWAAYLRRCPDLFQIEDFYKEQKNRGKKHKNNPMSIDNGKNLD